MQRAGSPHGGPGPGAATGGRPGRPMGGKQRCPGGPVPTPERARFLGTSARPTAALAQPESGFLEVTARGWGGGGAPGAWQEPDFRPAQAQVGVGRPLPCCSTPGPRLTPSFPELTVGWGSTPRSPGSRTPPPEPALSAGPASRALPAAPALQRRPSPFAAPTARSSAVCRCGWGQRRCTSNRFPGDAAEATLGTALRKPAASPYTFSPHRP